MRLIYTILGLLFVCCNIGAIMVHQTPLCKIYTPDSILAYKQNYRPVALEGRWRHATCTAATWFHGYYLAMLNFYGEKIDFRGTPSLF